MTSVARTKDNARSTKSQVDEARRRRPTATREPVPPPIQAIVDAKDRTDADRRLDASRHPGELLAFLGLRPGMRVAELSAGGGYTTELLARAVGPTGKVWAQNSAMFLKFIAKPWAERLGRPAMKNVVRSDRELEAPLPPDAKDLDAVLITLWYHDSIWVGADRDKMNKAVFDSLKHGGQYVVIDHSAVEGRGKSDAKTLHRIDELWVIRDVERAGFMHAAGADFLRNPADTRDWSDSPSDAGERLGTSDRFVAKFVKPDARQKDRDAREEAAESTRHPTSLEVPISAADHVRGSEGAAATLVEYGDFECSYCGRAYPVVRELERRFGAKLRIAFRHNPRADLHSNAEIAAEAAEAAGAQGKFWPMHDLLFEHQKALGEADLVAHAETLGLDVARFAKELRAHAHAARVHAEAVTGVHTVRSNPTFFINGVRFEDTPDLPTLSAAVERAVGGQ